MQQAPLCTLTDDMNIPDLSGYKLIHARELLNTLGIENVSVHLTAAPRLREAGYNDTSKVVRQSLSNDGILVLLVCNL